MKKKNLSEIAGWYGAVAIVTAYFLISFSLLTPTSIWYQALNLTGSFGIVVASFRKKDYPSTALNVVWILIGLVAITQIFFHR